MSRRRFMMANSRGTGTFGNIFDDNFAPRLTIGSDYTVVGTAPTLDGTGMILPSRVFGSFPTNPRIYRDVLSGQTSWHRFQSYWHSIEFGLGTPDASMLGPYIGADGGQLFWNVYGIWQLLTGVNRVVIYVSDAAGTHTAVAQSATGIVPVASRNYRLRFDATIGAQGSVYTITLTDLVTSASINTSWAEDVSISSGGTTKYAHKTARPVLSTAEVACKITNWQMSSDNLSSVPNLLVGDSITWGLCATNYAGGFARQVFPSGNYSISAGPSDRIVDVSNKINNLLAYNASRIFLFIGRNDIAAGTPIATVQSDYIAIVSSLKSNGASVVHLGPLHTGGNYDIFNAWLVTQFPGDIVVNSTVGMTFAADGVHPNQAGHNLIASNILAAI